MIEALPNRHSIRKRGWDYTTPGWYFLTINTHGGNALFGTIVNGRMVLNEAGRVAEAEWHRNYWDVIVQEEKSLANIRHYIRYNPQNYDAVMNVGAPHFAGNMALMDMPKVGFLASRGQTTPNGSWALEPGEAILSGFLSPMERAVFKICMENKQPMIWVKPWDAQDESASVRLAIEEGRLLMISPFDDTIEPSIRRAAWCNEYVLAHCNRLIIGHLNPDGMLNCILSELNPGKEISYL